MILNDNCFVMLLTRPFFQTFTPHTAVDARTATESIIALSADSKDAVDELVKNAIQAGATTFEEPGDQGFMYSWSFQDLDGHIWEVVWMDPSMLDV